MCTRYCMCIFGLDRDTKLRLVDQSIIWRVGLFSSFYVKQAYVSMRVNRNSELGLVTLFYYFIVLSHQPFPAYKCAYAFLCSTRKTVVFYNGSCYIQSAREGVIQPSSDIWKIVFLLWYIKYREVFILLKAGFTPLILLFIKIFVGWYNLINW